MGRTRTIFVAMLIMSTSCAKNARHPDAPTTTPLTEKQELAAQEAADRQEFVSAPIQGWKPESSGRKLRLDLSIADSAIHAGGHIRYRLNIQNIGDQDVLFIEQPSFIKNDLYGNEYKFFLIFPDGSEERILLPMLEFDSLPTNPGIDLKNMTPEQKSEALRRYVDNKRREGMLFLRLHPGETMSTRPEHSSRDRFRTLNTAYDFSAPGTYRIKIAYDSTGIPDGARAESNYVRFVVVR
jgi:hypothetical protein